MVKSSVGGSYCFEFVKKQNFKRNRKKVQALKSDIGTTTPTYY